MTINSPFIPLDDALTGAPLDLATGLIDSLAGASLSAAALLGVAIVSAAVAASLLSRAADSGLSVYARRKVAKARRNATRNNRAARDRPPVWRRQVKAEGAIYIRTLRAQLRAECGES